MKRITLVIMLIAQVIGVVYGQTNPLERLDFLIGKWSGTGSGFGNEKSKIESEFNYIMNGNYIEVSNDSKFEPTESKPDGEHHLDKGMISYDKNRKVIVYRQFNIEGYFNQYILNDTLSNDTILVFKTEVIENFVPGGKARWTIETTGIDQIETNFDVSFPEKEFACFGTNVLTKKE